MNNLIIPLVHAQESIPLPSGFASGTAAQAATTLQDLSPYLLLVVGVILAAVIIEIIIGALKK